MLIFAVQFMIERELYMKENGLYWIFYATSNLGDLKLNINTFLQREGD